MFQKTTAIKKILNLKKDVRIIQGGTAAGKTYGILPILIDDALRTPDDEISVVSETLPHLKKGAIKDFKKILKDTERWDPYSWHDTDKKYTFGNGAYIEFFGADNSAKVHGPRRKKLYVNEMDKIKFDTFHQLESRTSGVVYGDYNPTHEFWVHTEVIPDEDTDFIILTYKDNEAIPEKTLKKLMKAKKKSDEGKSKYWENYWDVYGLGIIGSIEGVIFTNWETIDKFPDDLDWTTYGQDFGFTNDPSALVNEGLKGEGLYLDELMYDTQMTGGDIATRYKKLGVSGLIIADTSHGMAIEDIKRKGFNIKPVIKKGSRGLDSVVYGLSIMQEYTLFVTKRSVNLIKELRNYSWEQDRDGKYINKPIDDWNHAIDAARYVAMTKCKTAAKSWVDAL